MFVGPSPEVIDGLGDKTKARTTGREVWSLTSMKLMYNLAMKIGVPVVPGTPGAVATYLEGADFVKEYGFPGQFDP